MAGIEALERVGVDCMIVGRGGGSIEDLWAFNEEKTAQAIFDCSVPVISAVGHETDYTIADFAADLRAPTPSAAAELAVYEYSVFLSEMGEAKRRMAEAFRRRIQEKRQLLRTKELRLGRFRPDYQVAEKRQLLDQYQDRLSAAMREKLKTSEHRLILLAERLKGLSPLNKITGGYAFVTKEDGSRLLSAKEASIGEGLSLHLADGVVETQVTEIKIEPDERTES